LTVGAPFAQGREKAKAFLAAHPVALEAILAATRSKMFAAATSGVTAPVSDDIVKLEDEDDHFEPKF
jgi:hypothetical protein